MIIKKVMSTRNETVRAVLVFSLGMEITNNKTKLKKVNSKFKGPFSADSWVIFSDKSSAAIFFITSIA